MKKEFPIVKSSGMETPIRVGTVIFEDGTEPQFDHVLTAAGKVLESHQDEQGRRVIDKVEVAEFLLDTDASYRGFLEQ